MARGCARRPRSRTPADRRHPTPPTRRIRAARWAPPAAAGGAGGSIAPAQLGIAGADYYGGGGGGGADTTAGNPGDGGRGGMGVLVIALVPGT